MASSVKWRCVETCRACGSDELTSVLTNDQPLANDFRLPTDPPSEIVPLSLLVCSRCSLAQLSVVVDPSHLYGRYLYRTSASRTMTDHLNGLLDYLRTVQPINSVVEVGSNDGRMLHLWKQRGVQSVIGIEPAENLVELAQQSGVPTIHRFLDITSASRASLRSPPIDLVIARHVFGHIDDWRDAISTLEYLAGDHTLVALEVPYSPDILSDAQFDTVYHEHLSYISVRSIVALLERSSLRLKDAVHFPIHGGAILMVIQRNAKASENVERYLAEETNLHEPSVWQEGLIKWKNVVAGVSNFVRAIRNQDSRICCYGASAKSTVMLNACKLSRADIDFITDTTLEKQGRISPGTGIPIVAPENLYSRNPAYAIISAWNFAQEIVEKESAYRANGGRFVIPIPQLKIVT